MNKNKVLHKISEPMQFKKIPKSNIFNELDTLRERIIKINVSSDHYTIWHK